MDQKQNDMTVSANFPYIIIYKYIKFSNKNGNMYLHVLWTLYMININNQLFNFLFTKIKEIKNIRKKIGVTNLYILRNVKSINIIKSNKHKCNQQL